VSRIVCIGSLILIVYIQYTLLILVIDKGWHNIVTRLHVR